jgi:hypothetical protein
MPPTPFDPCKQWLGIDAVDIGDPRRLLGLAPHEADPMNVLKAAQARLATLHAIAPGPYDVARTALMKRVEEAREKLLAQIAATRPAVVRPPVVPPPPPPAGFAPPPPPGRPAAAPAAPPAEFPPPSEPPAVGTRRPTYRRSSGGAWIALLLIAALGSAAGALARQKLNAQVPQKKLATKPAAVEVAGKPEAHAANPEPERPAPAPRHRVKRPEPRDDGEPTSDSEVSADRPPEPRKPLAPTAAAPVAMPPQPVKPAPPATPQPSADPAPPVDSTKKVEPLLRTVLAALQRSDFAAAEATIDSAHEKAADAELRRRVSRWGDLVTFARGFAEYRDKALASVKAGQEYDVDGKKVAVVEIDGKKFIYRYAGKNKTTPRDKIPGAILMAIVTEWFDEKPQNDLFLGAYHATKAELDLKKARGCWQRAAQRGADASSLLPLLDDPVLRAAAQ